MWLKCSYSNHSPGLIAGYYLESVAQVGGCPAKVRTDCGTENVLLASIQTIIVGQGAHAYGTSPSNQRIESWWSFFRRNHSQAYIDIFENLLATGAFQAGHFRQTECMRYCFMPLIQSDLDAIRLQWNTHRIRPTRGARCPAGIPDELYFLPPAGARDCLHRCSPTLPANIQDRIEQPRSCEDETLQAFFDYRRAFSGWQVPQTLQDAIVLYSRLVQTL